MKHNIMSEGSLSPGDILPDVTLWNLDVNPAKLRKTGIQVPLKLVNPSFSAVKAILASSYS